MFIIYSFFISFLSYKFFEHINYFFSFSIVLFSQTPIQQQIKLTCALEAQIKLRDLLSHYPDNVETQQLQIDELNILEEVREI